jgi:hypothetical protein
MDLGELEGLTDIERLAAYQRARMDEEARVTAALAKPVSERTQAENNVIAYSPFGTASKCG